MKNCNGLGAKACSNRLGCNFRQVPKNSGNYKCMPMNRFRHSHGKGAKHYHSRRVQYANPIKTVRTIKPDGPVQHTHDLRGMSDKMTLAETHRQSVNRNKATNSLRNFRKKVGVSNKVKQFANNLKRLTQKRRASKNLKNLVQKQRDSMKPKKLKTLGGKKSKRKSRRKSCKNMKKKSCNRSRRCSWNRNRKGTRKHKPYCSKKRSGRKSSKRRRRSSKKKRSGRKSSKRRRRSSKKKRC